MAIDSLLAKLQSDPDTSDTLRNGCDVSRKAVLTLACTPDTSDTLQIANSLIGKNHDWIKGNAEKIIPITRRQEETIKAWLIEIGEPEADHFTVLNKCKHDPEILDYYLGLIAEHGREKRRQKVLKMLADNPDIQRAFVTDAESNPDNVIIAFAIRDTGTCELLIPKLKYDAFQLLEIIEKSGIQ